MTTSKAILATTLAIVSTIAFAALAVAYPIIILSIGSLGSLASIIGTYYGFKNL